MEGENILTSQLYNIQETYVFEQTSIDKNLPRCVIDINNRNINVPIEIDSLGVQYDHRSNALIFEIDRYIDDVDLLTQSCIIQWINSGRDGENSGLCPVVMVDSSVEGKLLFCWEIFNESTQFPGNIFFAVRFYSMQDEDTFIWSYNTLPAQSIIEDTLDVVLRASIDIEPSMLELWNARMTELAKVADSSLSTSSYNAKEAEAWAHGRADFPNTIIDNAKYYSEMTKALYEDAQGSVIEEKENVIIAINDAKDEAVETAKTEILAEVESATDDFIAEVQNSVTTATGQVDAAKNEAIAEIENFGDTKYAAKENIPTKTSQLIDDVGYAKNDHTHSQYLTEHQDLSEYAKKSELPAVPVQSVNGKTGDVELTAEDVGATTKTYIDDVADQLKGDLTKRSNAIVQTASGESIVVNDASDDPLRGLRLFGKTEQFSTTGAQLLAYPYAHTTKSENGITFTDNGDGSISIKGTATNTATFAICSDLVLPKGTYAKNIIDNANYHISRFLRATNAYDSIPVHGGISTFSTEDWDYETYMYKVLIQISPTNGAVDKTIYPMLNKGDTALPYEPYTGGIPSPNPQYPQELVSVGGDGSVEVGVYSGNLLNPEATPEELDLVGDGSAIRYGYSFEGGKTYYIFDSSTNGQGYYYRTPKKDLSSRGTSVIIPNGGMKTIYVEEDCLLWVFSIVNDFSGICVSLANINEPYHKQTLTVLTPNGLPGIKVTDATLANYTDADGNMWCADEVDFERGVYVKRITHLTITSESNGAEYGMCDNGVTLQFPIGYEWLSANVVMCDMFPKNSRHNWNTYNNTVWLGSADRQCVQISVSSEIATSMAGFRTWLGDRVINAMVAIKEPIETPLTADELAQYQVLHSNYPVTTVMNDSGVHMEVKYNADTSTYIAQNYVPKSAYTELEARVLALETNAVS